MSNTISLQKNITTNLIRMCISLFLIHSKTFVLFHYHYYCNGIFKGGIAFSTNLVSLKNFFTNRLIKTANWEVVLIGYWTGPGLCFYELNGQNQIDDSYTRSYAIFLCNISLNSNIKNCRNQYFNCCLLRSYLSHGLCCPRYGGVKTIDECSCLLIKK